MKITPDSSVFQALSNFPKVGRESITPAPGQRTAEGQNAGTGSATEARDVARQEAIRQNREAIEKTRDQLRKQAMAEFLQKSKAAEQTGGTGSSLASSGNGGAPAHYREAPVAEEKPRFIRMGQFVDISI